MNHTQAIAEKSAPAASAENIEEPSGQDQETQTGKIVCINLQTMVFAKESRADIPEELQNCIYRLTDWSLRNTFGFAPPVPATRELLELMRQFLTEDGLPPGFFIEQNAWVSWYYEIFVLTPPEDVGEWTREVDEEFDEDDRKAGKHLQPYFAIRTHFKKSACTATSAADFKFEN